MSEMPSSALARVPSLSDSYAHCQQIARRSASSFYYSFLLLGKPKRRAMCALYAFLRRTDDLSDSDLGDNNRSADDRRAALTAWRGSLRRALQGQFDDPVLPALVDTLRTYAIPSVHLEDVISGVEMDLAPPVYQTFDQLAGYCHHVASAVGLACLRIWGCEQALPEQSARDCGVAFQMTNILRDLKEDAANGRIYLPHEDLDRFGYSADDLRAGIRNERFRELMRFEIARTERLYAAGAELDLYLSSDGRRVFGSMMSVYRALLDEIKRLDGDVLSSRVAISKWKKMRIASRWLLPRRTLASTAASAS